MDMRKFFGFRTKFICIFILLIMLVWIDELIDIPGIFYAAGRSPVNWLESIIETILIAAVGFFTISRFIPKQQRYPEEKELKRARYVWIPVLVNLRFPTWF